MSISGIEEVIFHAIRGKYHVDDDDLLRHLILPLVRGETPSGNFDRELYTDVSGQAQMLRNLHEDWRPGTPAVLDIDSIHKVLFAASGEGGRLRSTAYVADYQGNPPVPLADILSQKAIVDGMLRRVDALKDDTGAVQSGYLAELFSRIIASHVFFDGNGRVARTAVQYAVVRWGRPFMAIPKVRNAPRWKCALAKASVDQDTEDLARYFEELLARHSIDMIEYGHQRSVQDAGVLAMPSSRRCSRAGSEAPTSLRL